MVEQSVLQPRPSVFAEGNHLSDPTIDRLYGRSRVAPYPQVRLVTALALAPSREDEGSRGDIQVIRVCFA